MATNPSTVLTQLWPQAGKQHDLWQTLEITSQQEIGTELRQSIQSLNIAQKLSEQPILAVTGQLNSGKSSVVATFLSDKGKRRLPRGTSSKQGTHRFIYWVPQSWLDDTTFKKQLLELIAVAHHGSIEFLSEDPEKAYEQYRSGRDNLQTLNIPLIAGDPALEELGCGLLDCPDIQTQDDIEPHGEPISDNPRLDFLVAASRVCSAFLVVWSRPAIRDRLLDQMLTSLRQRMQKAPLYLLINLIRPEPGQPEMTLTDEDVTRHADKFSISKRHIYGAFDFGIPAWREFTPAAQVQAHDEATPELTPQFYLLAEGKDTDHSLSKLPKLLDAAEIQRSKIGDHQSEIANHLANIWHKVNTWNTTNTEEIRGLRDGICQICHGLMSDEVTGEPLQIVSEEFAAALNESLVRTAPFALRMTLRLAKPFEKSFSSSMAFLKSLNMKKVAKEKVGEIQKKVEEHLQIGTVKLASSSHVTTLMRTMRWCPQDISKEDITKGWETSFERFQSNPIKNFNDEILDESSRAYWDGFSGMKKFTLGGRALLGTVGSLAAVFGIATIAVDGGATMYAATSVSAALHSGTAAVVAGAGSVAALAGFQKKLLENNTLPYLSRLFSIACDTFGIPRQVAGDKPIVEYTNNNGIKTKHELIHPSDLPEFHVVTPLTKQSIYTFNEDAKKLSPEALDA